MSFVPYDLNLSFRQGLAESIRFPKIQKNPKKAVLKSTDFGVDIVWELSLTTTPKRPLDFSNWRRPETERLSAHCFQGIDYV